MAAKDDNPAKRAVIKEWDDWTSKHSEDVVGDGMLFFGYLQRERPGMSRADRCTDLECSTCLVAVGQRRLDARTPSALPALCISLPTPCFR